MTVYAGSHGGCMMCDSSAYELAARGHRPGCRSSCANEPPEPKPPKREQARVLREEAACLRETAAELEAEAQELDRD